MRYSIDAVSRLTGISQHTLRNWEKRFSFMRPDREGNGFRRYAESDIALLKRIAGLLEAGHRIGDLADSLDRGETLPEVASTEADPEISLQLDQLRDALLGFDQERAESICSQLAGRYSASKVLESVFQPLFVRMGRDWAEGTISIAQEHYSSAFIRARLMPYLNFFVPARSARPRSVVCATVSGERHEGGLLLFAAQLKLRGWLVHYLGADLPMEELKEVALRVKPTLICLSYIQTELLKVHLQALGKIPATLCIGGFGAGGLDPAIELPENIHVFRVGGSEAAELLEMLADAS